MELWSLTESHAGFRKHIWSFVAASSKNSNGITSYPSTNNCSNIVQNLQTPSVIGSSYFYDTGVTGAPSDGQFYADNPLWDGQGCGPYNSCCEFNNPPWFCKHLPVPTNEDIEVRLVATANHINLDGEDTPIEKIDICSLII